MVSDKMKKVLRMVDNGQIYWTRKGGSAEYMANVVLVKQAIKEGLVVFAPMDCCRKDYLLTARGASELRK